MKFRIRALDKDRDEVLYYEKTFDNEEEADNEYAKLEGSDFREITKYAYIVNKTPFTVKVRGKDTFIDDKILKSGKTLQLGFKSAEADDTVQYSLTAQIVDIEIPEPDGQTFFIVTKKQNKNNLLVATITEDSEYTVFISRFDFL